MFTAEAYYPNAQQRVNESEIKWVCVPERNREREDHGWSEAKLKAISKKKKSPPLENDLRWKWDNLPPFLWFPQWGIIS